jgi:hypothetical protein
VTVVGVLHPGEMGAVVAGALRERGETVLWASAGRSAATAERARRLGSRTPGTSPRSAAAARSCSICPPHAAVEVARAASGFAGIYVDANAIAPDTAGRSRSSSRSCRRRHRRAAAEPVGTTRLYLSGEEAERIATLFAGTNLEARVLSREPGAASALKAAYAGWTKGSAALLLTIRELGRAEGVEDALLEEWRLSIPELEDHLPAAERSAGRKGWRWVGEMEEIAHSMDAHDLPTGFHEAAAEVFRRAAKKS